MLILMGEKTRLGSIKGMFSGGQQGAIYEPADLANLFLLPGDATPNVANGDAVGKILDISGRANHATQSTAASRPISRATYLEFDGSDDFLTSAAGGGGTSGFLFCAGIRASGAGTTRILWSDRGTNTGYRVAITTANQIQMSAGNGAAQIAVTDGTITAGTDYVVTAWHDGVNINVRIGLGAITSAAFVTASAGTAGFTIARDNGAATNRYGSRIYGMVYRMNDTSSQAQRENIIRYMSERSGAAI